MANPRIDDLRKRLEKEPGSRLFAQLAEELRKEGDLAEAIRVCREGLQKQPNYPSAHMTLGRALFDNGDLDGARAEFDAVLKGAPDNILASRLLGECLERLGDAEGALARFRGTLTLAPGDRQVTAKIQALEQGGATRVAAPEVRSSEATVIISSPVARPPAPLRQAWPPPEAVAPAPASDEDLTAAPVAAETGPPPIPVRGSPDEPFELEKPYEAPTLVGWPTAWHGQADTAAAASPVDFAADPATGPGDVEESFEAEPGSPAPPAAEAAVEASFDFDAGTVEPVETWQAPPVTFTPEFGEPAPPVPALSASATSSAAELEMSTATLAELYLSQGVLDKAIEVYRQLLEREPGNERARTRLVEIQALDAQLRAEEARAAAEGSPAPSPGASRRQAIERTIARLEALLVALKGTR